MQYTIEDVIDRLRGAQAAALDLLDANPASAEVQGLKTFLDTTLADFQQQAVALQRQGNNLNNNRSRYFEKVYMAAGTLSEAVDYCYFHAGESDIQDLRTAFSALQDVLGLEKRLEERDEYARGITLTITTDSDDEEEGPAATAVTATTSYSLRRTPSSSFNLNQGHVDSSQEDDNNDADNKAKHPTTDIDKNYLHPGWKKPEVPKGGGGGPQGPMGGST